MSTPATQQPNPQLFFQTVNAFHRTHALKTAIELEVFTAIAEGNRTAADIARRCQTSERGMRILCDYLCILGFVIKQGENYSLTHDSAIFLDKHSPAYIADATQFLLSPMLTQGFERLTEAVKKGGTAMAQEGTITPENPVWVDFARAMAPLMAMPAQAIVSLIDPQRDRRLKILDIAAGHGMYGIAFAKNNSQAEVVAVDWPSVLNVARENARTAGVLDRYRTIEGSAFDVNFGTGYDLVLITNFLHHFDPPTCEALLRKVYAALTPSGRALTLEFVPNEDRISPEETAGFSLIMLSGTPAGDAYTFSELDRMFKNAGFKQSEIQLLPPGMEHLLISQK